MPFEYDVGERSLAFISFYHSYYLLNFHKGIEILFLSGFLHPFFFPFTFFFLLYPSICFGWNKHNNNNNNNKMLCTHTHNLSVTKNLYIEWLNDIKSVNIDRHLDEIRHGYVALINAFASPDFIRNGIETDLTELLWKWLIKNIVTILVRIMKMFIVATVVLKDVWHVQVQHLA